jgi:hypothetical protein
MRPEHTTLPAQSSAGTVSSPRDGDAALAPKRRLWRPTKRQQRYLELWLDPTKPRNVYGLAPLIPCAPRSIYEWLHNPAFVAWFNSQVEDATEHLWRPILHKTSQLALQGSVEHAKLIAQIRGALRNDDGHGRGGVGVQVVIGVPRAGDRVELPADAPMPALPPAPSTEQH